MTEEMLELVDLLADDLTELSDCAVGNEVINRYAFFAAAKDTFVVKDIQVARDVALGALSSLHKLANTALASH